MNQNRNSGIQWMRAIAAFVFIGLSLIVCACLGVLCFKYVEKPLIRWLSARISYAPKLRTVS